MLGLIRMLHVENLLETFDTLGDGGPNEVAFT